MKVSVDVRKASKVRECLKGYSKVKKTIPCKTATYCRNAVYRLQRREEPNFWGY